MQRREASLHAPLWKRSFVVLVILATSLVHPHVATGQNDPDSVSGSYLLDSRPEELWFLSLTQVGQMITGYALAVEPDDTGVLSQQQYNVEGTTDGSYIFLTIGDAWSGSFSMSGSEEDDDLILSYPSDAGGVGTAVFQGASTEEFNQALTEWQNAGAAQEQLSAWLLTEADMPQGVYFSHESSLSQEQAASAYPELDATDFSQWGWVASVDRSFTSSGRSEPSDDVETVMVTLHQFGSVDSATEAIHAFVSSDEFNGWERSQSDAAEAVVLTIPVSGNGIIPDGVEVIVYLQLGDYVAQIRGFAFGGDPTADTLELARRLYDPTYRATAQELKDYISIMETAAEDIGGLEQGARARLDEVQLAVDDLLVLFDDLELQASAPLDCFALESLEFTYEDTMEFAYAESLSFAQGQYQDAVEEFDAAVDALEATPAGAADILERLSEGRNAMPAPIAEAPDSLFNDEQASIDALALQAGNDRLTIDSLNASYNELIASADSIMEDGETLVEGVRADLNCQSS